MLTKCRPLAWNYLSTTKLQELHADLQCFQSFVHLYDILTEKLPLNLSDQLRWRFLNEWTPNEVGKPHGNRFSVPEALCLLIAVCHFDLLKHIQIGSLAGFKLQTLESEATHSSI